MTLSIGLVGLPNAGKSTLFNALTQADVAAADYPFTTIDAHTGVVKVPDSRLTTLADLLNPPQVIHSTVEFIDIAGLIKGSSQGEGLGNQFLGHIREVDAIGMVVRCFKESDVSHVYESIDPVRDVEILHLELCLADLRTVENRIEKVMPLVRQSMIPKSVLDFLETLKDQLGEGTPARTITPPDIQEVEEILADMHLLTSKPLLYIANASESQLSQDSPPEAQPLIELAAEEGTQIVVLSSKLEQELTELPEEDIPEYMELFGLKHSRLDDLIAKSYRLLNLITFFTFNEKELRAWALERGKTTPQAAGKIHTDMQRGFIGADVINANDFISFGSMDAAKKHGAVRLEGKDYVVQDGDILLIRFNV